MRSIKLTKAVKYGMAGALVPALGLAAGITDGLITGFSGAAAIITSMAVMRFTPSENSSGASPAIAVVVPGFIAGLLWISRFSGAEEPYVAAYLAAFALCVGGAIYTVDFPGSRNAGFSDTVSAASGFFIICFLLGLVRQFIFLTSGQSLFVAGIIIFAASVSVREVFLGEMAE